MARANLNISADIDEAFVKAQESRTVRILTVKIQAEELVLAGSIEKLSSNAHEDFDSILIESLADDQAAFVLFCLDDDPSSVAADSALSWCMITWIPDSCKVRDKMLYSSSREDLKRHMGIGYFKTEYAANYKTDISWQQYKQSLSKDVNSDMLTESERLVQEEKVALRYYAGLKEKNCESYALLFICTNRRCILYFLLSVCVFFPRGPLGFPSCVIFIMHDVMLLGHRFSCGSYHG